MNDLLPMSVFQEMSSRNETLRRICLADSATRNRMIKKPAIKDLLDIPIPYTVENVPLITEGVHNGDFYPASVLRESVAQHEGLQIFADHHNNFLGGTVLTFCGMIHDPYWSEELKSIVAGKVDFIIPDIARALAYGAKFGLSCTVDADTRIDPNSRQKAVFSPVFRSYSVVLDPACRETMMNEKKHEVIDTEGEPNGLSQDLASDFVTALANSLTQKYGMDAAAMLTGKKKEYPEVYGYPEKKKKMEEDLEKASMEAKAALEAKKGLESSVAKLEADMKKLSADMETSKAENAKLSQELAGYKAKELEAEITGVIEAEKTLGMLQADGVTARLEELKKLSMPEIMAISGQLERTLKATEGLDATPSELGLAAPAAPTQKQLGAHTAQDGHDGARRMLEMMRKAQGG